MGLEIERRFLVRGDRWRKFAGPPIPLRQGYLAIDSSGLVVRVRIHSEKESWITIKSPAQGIAQNEFEYVIPLADAEELWQLSKYRLIKRRFEIDFNEESWIVDCFEGDNSPLCLAEIELLFEGQQVEIPDWCDQEITGELILSNASLSKDPISKWPHELRKKFHI